MNFNFDSTCSRFTLKSFYNNFFADFQTKFWLLCRDRIELFLQSWRKTVENRRNCWWETVENRKYFDGRRKPVFELTSKDFYWIFRRSFEKFLSCTRHRLRKNLNEFFFKKSALLFPLCSRWNKTEGFLVFQVRHYPSQFQFPVQISLHIFWSLIGWNQLLAIAQFFVNEIVNYSF